MKFEISTDRLNVTSVCAFLRKHKEVHEIDNIEQLNFNSAVCDNENIITISVHTKHDKLVNDINNNSEILFFHII